MIRRVDRAEAHRLGQTLFQTYRRMAIRLRLPAPKVPRLDDAEPAEAAALVRSTMGLSPDTPIKHLINSVERLGVVVLGLPTSLPHRDAFSVWAGDMPVIALSAGLPGDRIRFTVAHELGHLALHQSPRGIITALEGAANEFASALLLPMPTIAEELAEGVTLSRLAVLKARWGVSIQTLARKARDLNLLTERQYHGVFEQLARMGYGRKSEPGPIAVEKPRALRQMAERLYGVPLDYPRFAADSKLPQALLRDIMNAHAEGRAASTPATGKLLTMKR
jgi:Zn-dependent peptidase ImmA (M78 family)